MWQDPIVNETRKLREQYAKQFKHNLDAIFQDIRKLLLHSNACKMV